MYALTGTQIIFYYPIDTILDVVKMYSQYSSRGVKSEGDIEEMFITDADLTLIHSEATSAISSIFQMAVRLSRGVPNSLLTNNSLSINGQSLTGIYGFRLNDYKGYNANLLGIIDNNIQSLWTALIMQSWLTITRQFDLLKLYQ